APALVGGSGAGENFVAPDVPAILAHTRRMMFLEEGELADIRKSGVVVTDLDGKKVERAPKVITWSSVMAEKAGFKHFMLKEIHEQPRAVTDTLRGRLSPDTGDVTIDGIELDLQQIKRITILACGTSWHAALVGKFMIEQLA